MKNTADERRRRSMNSVRGISGMVMGCIYLLVAVAVVYAQKQEIIFIGDVFSYGIAALMILYGIFRIYRGWKIHNHIGY